MTTQIQTIHDVKLFAYQILNKRISFHSDDDFNDYIFFKKKTLLYPGRCNETKS